MSEKEKEVEEEIKDEENRKSIILIIIAILITVSLMLLLINLNKDKVPTKEPDEDVKIDTREEDSGNTAEVVSKKTVAMVTTKDEKKYTVIYLDMDGNQLGKTQTLKSLDDRVNEKAPKIDGMRFDSWKESYDELEDIYYYCAIYRQIVEKIESEENNKIVYHKVSNEYTVSISKIEEEEEPTEEEVIPEEEIEILEETYEVAIEGTVPLDEIEERDETITISDEYKHIIALRVNAPEGTTKEEIENMTIDLYATNEEDSIDADQYSYNGEDTTKKGRELLDSTDEEYENDIFYFNYYQETDTLTNTTLEVNWGTKKEEKDVVEVYNINLENAENEEKTMPE